MFKSFLKRLRYYGIGFGMGVIIVMFLLPNRSCSWTPSNRVKNMILNRVLTVNEIDWKLMQSKGITKQDILSVLNDGEIDFGKSKKDAHLKVYVIEKELKGKGNYKFYFTLPEETYISEVKIGEIDAKKVENSTEGYGLFISVPKDEFLVSTDSTFIVSCQMEKIGIKSVKQLYWSINKSGRINFSKSDLGLQPKPTQNIEFVYGKDTVSAQSTWYKNKIFITDFKSEKSKDCEIDKE
ncbi:MAG: DUF4258 domain-containing protein [Crocinitomicaceae bacterium]|nr:DUF4258 domain-containing protein [Crocinitomicaceae bacterium]